MINPKQTVVKQCSCCSGNDAVVPPAIVQQDGSSISHTCSHSKSNSPTISALPQQSMYDTQHIPGRGGPTASYEVFIFCCWKWQTYIYILPKYIHRDWNWRLRQIAEYIHIYILGIGIGVSAKLRICHTWIQQFVRTNYETCDMRYRYRTCEIISCSIQNKLAIGEYRSILARLDAVVHN